MLFFRAFLNPETLVGSKSKDSINEVDLVLAEHYGFSADELDFIVNYDIKFRMGSTDDEE